jgi:hypothetical protein
MKRGRYISLAEKRREALKKQQLDTAFHEAGHTVTALLTGSLIDFVTITCPQNNTTGRTGNTRVILTRDLDKIYFLAGEAVDTKRGVADITQEEDDPTAFIQRTGQFYGSTDVRAVLNFYKDEGVPLSQWTDRIRALRRQAEEMIAKSEVWIKIETVAHLLLERQTLKCEDIYEKAIGKPLSQDQLNVLKAYRASSSPVINKGDYSLT